MKEDIFICKCHSPEHQLIFRHDSDENEIYFEVHLNQYRNIFKRILVAIKYIFGYKSRYGSWDCFVFKNKDIPKFIKYLQNVKRINNI